MRRCTQEHRFVSRLRQYQVRETGVYGAGDRAVSAAVYVAASISGPLTYCTGGEGDIPSGVRAVELNRAKSRDAVTGTVECVKPRTEWEPVIRTRLRSAQPLP
jgi:hypothetical protein